MFKLIRVTVDSLTMENLWQPVMTVVKVDQMVKVIKIES